MVLMVPRRGQGFAGEVPGSPGQLVKAPLQVDEPLPLDLLLVTLVILLIPIDGLQGVDQ